MRVSLKRLCVIQVKVCESLVGYSGCLSRTVAKMSLLILDSISNWKLEILSFQSGFLTGTKGVLTDPQVRPDFAIQDGNKGHKRLQNCRCLYYHCCVTHNTQAMFGNVFGNVLQWKIRTCFKSKKTGTALDLQITSNGSTLLGSKTKPVFSFTST